MEEEEEEGGEGSRRKHGGADVCQGGTVAAECMAAWHTAAPASVRIPAAGAGARTVGTRASARITAAGAPANPFKACLF